MARRVPSSVAIRGSDRCRTSSATGGAAGVGSGSLSVRAEHGAPAVEDVVVEGAGRRIVVHQLQVDGEVVRGGEGVRVVLAEHGTAPDESGFVQLAGPVELVDQLEPRGKVARGGESGRVLVAEPLSVQLVGTVKQRQRCRRITPGGQVHCRAAEQPGDVLRHVDSRAVHGHGGQNVGKQRCPAWPCRRVVPHLLGRRRPQKADQHRGPAARIGVRSGAEHGGGHAMKSHRMHSDRRDAAPMEEPRAAPEGEGVDRGHAKSVRQQAGVLGHQAQRHRLRRAPGDHRQQVQRGRIVDGQPVERDLPRRRRRPRIGAVVVLAEQLVGPLAHHAQVGVGVDRGVCQQRPGLFQRQREVPERVRDPFRVRRT